MLPTQLPKLRIALTSSSRLLSSPSPSRHFTSSSSSSKLKSKPKPSSHSSTTTEDAAEGPERPQISYLTLSTLYPFLLLSIMTSLALNLSHNRSKFKDEELTSRARISILERIILRLQQNDRLISEGKGKGKAVGGGLSEEEQEIIERELELVGLGRGKGKKVMKADGTITTTGDEEVGTSWREVFLGKKGKEWEEPDEVDWEKVFKDADDKDKKNLLLAKQQKSTIISNSTSLATLQDSEPIESSQYIPVASIPIVKAKPVSASQFL